MSRQVAPCSCDRYYSNKRGFHRKDCDMRKSLEAEKKWVEPGWMKAYHGLLNAGGWATPEEVMNCDGGDCNIVVNAPRALICNAMSSRVGLLMRLHAAGKLKP